MNIQEAIQSGKPFRRKGWVNDDIYVVYDWNDIALALATDPGTSVELDVQDILAEDWYTRNDVNLVGQVQTDQSVLHLSTRYDVKP